MSEYRLVRVYTIFFPATSKLLPGLFGYQGFFYLAGPFCEGFRRGLVFGILIITVDAFRCFAEFLLYLFRDVDLDLSQFALFLVVGIGDGERFKLTINGL